MTMKKNKVLRWCVRIEVSELWTDFPKWSKNYPLINSPAMYDYIWWDFGFETAKERKAFLKDHREKYGTEMGMYGQICLYKEIEG